MMYSYGMFWLRGLFQFAILLLFFVVVWWMVKNNEKFGFKCQNKDTAQDILNKRLAKGEINTREYKSLRKEIK